MSHELRTPLNSILGFAQVLEMASLLPDDLDSVDQILKGGKHLLNLINEVLDVARIEAGRLSLSLEPVHLAEVIQEAIDFVRPLAQQRSIAIGIVSEACDAHVQADRQRLRQVLLNLLANGVKYNVDGVSSDRSFHRIAGERRYPDGCYGHGPRHLPTRARKAVPAL